MTAHEIAEQLGLSPSRVYQLLKQNRLKRSGDTWHILPGRNGSPPRLRQSQTEIARQLGLSRDRIGDLYRAGRLIDLGTGWKIAPKETTKPIDIA